MKRCCVWMRACVLPCLRTTTCNCACDFACDRAKSITCQVHNDSLVPYDIVSRTTALAARLGAADRQLGREHLRGAVLCDFIAGEVHDP